MNRSVIRELRIRAMLGHAPDLGELVTLLEHVEDAIDMAECCGSSDLADEIDTLRARTNHTEDEWEDLEKEVADLAFKLESRQSEEPDVIAIPRSPQPTTETGRIIRVDFTSARRMSAEALYQRASEIDDDPSRQAEAAGLYERAITLDPTHARAHCNLGNVRHRQNEDGEARRLYGMALEIDPRCTEALYNLGFLDIESGCLDDAVSRLMSVVEIDSVFADAWFNLGTAYDLLGQKTKAAECWRSYLRLEPVGEWADSARSNLDAITRKLAQPKRLRRRTS